MTDANFYQVRVAKDESRGATLEEKTPQTRGTSCSCCEYIPVIIKQEHEQRACVFSTVSSGNEIRVFYFLRKPIFFFDEPYLTP